MRRKQQAYFGESFDEDSIRNHFTLVYELMDETMDFGYPQNCAIEVLRQYINLGTVQQVRRCGMVGRSVGAGLSID